MNAGPRKLIRVLVFENLGVVLAVAFAGSQLFLAMWGWTVLAEQPIGALGAWGAAAVALTVAHLLILHNRGGTKILSHSFQTSAQVYVITTFSLACVALAVAIAAGTFTTAAAMLGLAGPNHEMALALLQTWTGLAGLAAVGTVADGLAAARRLPRIRNVRIELADLPPPLAGLRIAHVSDIHVGNGYTPTPLAELVEHINGLEADVIAITGDIFDRDPAVLDAGAAALSGLRARLGVYAVLGNHDAYAGKERVATALATHAPAVRLLRGRIALLETDPPIAIAGIDDPGDEWRVTEEGAEALAAIARECAGHQPSLLLVHRPDVFPQAAAGGFALVLAGHYHGGQIALPGSRGTANVARLITRYDSGTYTIGAARLHVTRGIGCAGPRLRVACPPEISLIELGTCRTLTGQERPRARRRSPA